MNYKVVSLEERYDLFEKQDKISNEVWPEFIFHDAVSTKYWMKIMELFSSYQLLMLDGDDIIAVINSIPLNFSNPLSELPEEGWDWGLSKSMADYDNGISPNMLMGVQIVINKSFQGRGLSSIATGEMLNLAKQKGLSKVIIPVRPSDKSKYPLFSMEEYLLWKNKDGLPFDNWIRVHCKLGGKIEKICHKAMTISGTTEDWKKWTGIEFPASGEYTINGALNPIVVNKDKNEGIYTEPNVWVIHNVP